MNEVEKMYKNCKIKKQYCGWLDMGDLDTQYTYIRCDSLEEFNDTATMSRTSYSSEEEDWDKPSIEYPPFTAEKQLLLLQVLARIESADYFQFFFYEIKQEWVFRLNMLTELSCESAYIYESRNKNFDECIAGLINIIWQDLTEEDKQQIKEILK